MDLTMVAQPKNAVENCCPDAGEKSRIEARQANYCWQQKI
jgi:hypothetical protein